MEEAIIIKREELPKALKKRRRQGARLFPIVLSVPKRKVDWLQVDWLHRTQVFPRRSRGMDEEFKTPTDIGKAYQTDFMKGMGEELDKLCNWDDALRLKDSFQDAQGEE